MSTYYSTFTARKGRGSTTLAPYCVLTGLLSLLIVQSAIFFSPTALAFQRATQPENLTRIGASVVRIVATYTPEATASINIAKTANSTVKSANSAPIACTGLGVIIASWTGEANERNTYILTDGSLVNNEAFTCGVLPLPSSGINPGVTPVAQPPSTTPVKNVRLANISIYFSTAYNSTIQVTVNDIATAVQCNAEPCNNGVSLISYHSNTPLPLAILSGVNDSSLPDASAIQLSPSSIQIATPTAASAPQHFLTPTAIAPSNTGSFESGTPIVDQHGYLNKLFLKNSTGNRFVSASEIQALLNNLHLTPGAHPNTVNDAWQSGVTAYAQGSEQFATANKDFSQAFNASNGQFQGAQTFVNQTAESGATTVPGINGLLSNGIPYFLLAIIAGGIIVVIMLLFLLTLLFRRGQRGRENSDRSKLAARDSRQPQHQEQEALRTPLRASAPQGQPLAQPQSAYSIPQAPNNVANAPQFAPAFMSQSRASADFPTVELHNNGNKQVNSSQGSSSSEETEMTQPYPHKPQPDIPQPSNNQDGMDFDVVTNTNPGIKRKYKPNEDSLFAVRGLLDGQGQPQKYGLFVVADGMGGHANGQDASRLAIQTIINYIVPRLMHNETNQENAEKVLTDSVQLANQAVHQHNVENNADMGTTVTATLIIDTTAHVANVGDSRTYLYRTSEGLKKVTRDHSVVASLVDAGIIKEDDIYTHPKRNQIYRSLGEKPFVEVDPFTVQLQAGDKILMCSDGLWDMVRDPVIRHVLEKSVSEPKEIGSNLINAALDGGGEDNVSVIVVDIINHPSQLSNRKLEIIYLQDNVQMPTL